MNGSDASGQGEPPGEFETIARLMAPLTRGAPEALGLQDDAAVLASRPGFDLVISQDAMTEGVHFLPGMPMDKVARRLLRAALSDLAAKAAEPFAYLLTVAWPSGAGWATREAFARGLAQDGAEFGVSLIGGDTVSTPGPFMASVTVLGWVPAGRMLQRGRARAGELLVVSGTIGDGWLGLLAARGEIAADPWLIERFERPSPRFDLRAAIRSGAAAGADVSDGLLADAGHIAAASGLGADIELDRLPLSPPAMAWLEAQPDRAAALVALASGGDDYELVLAVSPPDLPTLMESAGAPLTVIGMFTEAPGVNVLCGGAPTPAGRQGWRHPG